MKCTRCGALILPPATGCSCASRAQTAPAPTAAPSEPPPLSPSAAARIIPTKNKPALIGYYVAIASAIPLLFFLGVVAIGLGFAGLGKARKVGVGTGHAVTAIVIGLAAIVVWGGDCLGWWRIFFGVILKK